MNQEVVILIADDDQGHAELIRRNLVRAGIANPLIHFKDGQEVVDFLTRQGSEPHRKPDTAYVLLLDIRMPKLDGVEVLSIIKQDPELKKIPVIMITTTDDPREVERCHLWDAAITSPSRSVWGFVNAIRQPGSFSRCRCPEISAKRDTGRRS